MIVTNVRKRSSGAPRALDPYAAPAMAWSLDRQLLTAYSGNLLQVHNGTTDANIGISAGRFNSTALASHVTGGLTGRLTQVYDQSGNSRHMVGQAGTKLRVVNAGANELQNGKLIGRGTDTTGLCYTNTFTAYTGTVLSSYCVIVPTNTANYERVGLTFTKDADADYSATTRMAINTNGTNTDIVVSRSGGAFSPYFITGGTCYAVTARADGATTTEVKIRGLTGTTSLAVTSAFDINRVLLFGETIAASKSTDGIKFGEGAVWFADLGASNLTAIATEAATYWGAA